MPPASVPRRARSRAPRAETRRSARPGARTRAPTGSGAEGSSTRTAAVSGSPKPAAATGWPGTCSRRDPVPRVWLRLEERPRSPPHCVPWSSGRPFLREIRVRRMRSRPAPKFGPWYPLAAAARTIPPADPATPLATPRTSAGWRDPTSGPGKRRTLRPQCAHGLGGPHRPAGRMTDDSPGTSITAFLIADVRGYTLFTQERGDEAAAKLAAKFAAIAREAVAARGGEVIELRGDEALAVFDSPRQAIRAAIDLQDRFVEETLADPAIPLTVGIGLDAGEAVRVEGGYRGGALNLAARLCGQAGPGEVMASQEIVHLARRIDGVRYADRGQFRLKGMSEPVALVRVSSAEADAAERLRPIAAARRPPAEDGPPPRPSGLTRRRVLIAAVALAVVAAGIAIPLSLAGGGSSKAPTVAAHPNSVARVDLETGGVVADTPLQSAPGAVATSGDAIWVTEPDAGKVVRLDPKDGTVIDTITVGNDPAGIAVGGGFVWVVNSGDPSVSRISLQTGDVVDPITEGIGNGPQDVAVGAGAVWVTNRIDGTVSRIELDLGEVTDTIPLSDTPTGIVARPGGVWVSGPSTGTVVRIDPASNAVAGTTNVGNGPGAVQADDTGIWVANTLDGTVSRIDPRSGSVDATVAVGDGPAAIAFGGGSAWVTNEFAGTISRIDVRTKASSTLPLGSEPRGAVVADGQLWVAGRGAATSHRGGTLELIGDRAPDSIDPAVSYDEVSWHSLTLVYDGLVGFKRVGGADGGLLVPDLAEGIPAPTDGGLTYRFTLRRGIRYSTGAQVRASDFRIALRRGFEIPDTPVPLLYDVLAGAAGCRPGHAPATSPTGSKPTTRTAPSRSTWPIRTRPSSTSWPCRSHRPCPPGRRRSPPARTPSRARGRTSSPPTDPGRTWSSNGTRTSGNGPRRRSPTGSPTRSTGRSAPHPTSPSTPLSPAPPIGTRARRPPIGGRRWSPASPARRTPTRRRQHFSGPCTRAFHRSTTSVSGER